ncbi:hypothetical protein [Rhodovulum steppense]|uniref:Uncharacterized protein n=1 Tax=Rhodovulum steppense TaxID=540251 RepID=A0A4R1YJJ3_9RHOB|nr:hypothetical protein [Rhodovulum steppense]TCM76967.1 hypothetical protein EV216_13120 [Rhodovulum steppense]
MNNNTLLIGGVVVAAAFAFVVTQKRSGTEDAEIESRVAALNDRIGELESSLAEVTERADAQAAVIAETATLGSRLAETVQGLGEVSGSVAETAAAPAPADAPEAAPVTAAAAVDAGVGETAIFGDGAVRVFLSRVDAAAGTARIAVNGLATTTLAVGESVEADGACSVTLGGVEGNRASLGYACGS